MIFTVNKRRTRVHRRTSHYRRMEAIAVVVCRELDDVCATLSVYDLYMLCIGHHDDCAGRVYISETLVLLRESCGAGDFWLGLKDQW